jgi:hypothetical protein
MEQLLCTQSEFTVQVAPSAKAHSFVLQVPPAQSLETAQNTPFGSAQTPALHVMLVQSDDALHGWHTPCAQCSLAQSRSSLQVSPACSLQNSAAHVPLKQSLLVVQTCPSAFFPLSATQAPAPSHAEPAPHVAVTSPLGTCTHVPVAHESEHDPEQAVGQQTPPLQGVVAQFAMTRHILPAAHGGQLPPQSTSVSSPSFIMSLQSVHLPLVHAFDLQSLGWLHVLPTPQPTQWAPPQSTSDSSPFFIWSEQLAHASL